MLVAEEQSARMLLTQRSTTSTTSFPHCMMYLGSRFVDSAVWCEPTLLWQHDDISRESTRNQVCAQSSRMYTAAAESYMGAVKSTAITGGALGSLHMQLPP